MNKKKKKTTDFEFEFSGGTNKKISYSKLDIQLLTFINNFFYLIYVYLKIVSRVYI